MTSVANVVDRLGAYVATRERQQRPRVAKLCKVCRVPSDRMVDGPDDWSHEWPDCDLLADLVAAYKGGRTIRAIVAMASERGNDIWYAGTLGAPSYNLVRQRLLWAGVLRNRGPRQRQLTD